MSIVTKQLTLTGAAGSASASASTHALMQRLVPVEVLRDGQPNTLNVTVANSARTLLTLTGITADRLVAPKLPVQSATGSDLPDEVDSPWVNGALTITATGGNAGTLTVRLVLA